MSDHGLKSYVIRGGEEGRARLGVLASVLAPTTRLLFDRLGPFTGFTVVDVACGGGDVSFELAERVGANGSVHGLDLDPQKLALARSDAEERGLANLTFHAGDVTAAWPIASPRLAYARFILTHLTDPSRLLARAIDALAPGGLLVVEDIDMGGHFCDPPCPAYQRYHDLYVEAGQRRGADPFIGRRLARLLDDAGFVGVDTSLVQPYGRTGDAKRIASLTLAAIADGVVADGLATREEVTSVGAELDAFAARPDTTIALPRIFQAWGTKP